jgi:hypothetical protein
MFQRHWLAIAAALLLEPELAMSVELPWWLQRVEVVAPEPGQIGAVQLAGIWRDGCVPDAVSSEHQGSDLYLTVTQPGLHVGCPEVETSWSLTHEYRAIDRGYSIFGTLVAVDPADRNLRELLSSPDLLTHVGRPSRAVFHGLGSTGDPYASGANEETNPDTLLF